LSSRDVKLRYEKCLGNWGNASFLILKLVLCVKLTYFAKTSNMCTFRQPTKFKDK